MEGNYKLARERGYVEDLWGRRRHLPDASLPKYEFEVINKKGDTFNPLPGTTDRKIEVNKFLVEKYKDKLDKCRTKEARDVVAAEAIKDNLRIKCNSGFIAQAERQSINSPIQGGSATITKLAMRNMYQNSELRKLDFHLLVPVHDEIIAEVPIWNLDKAEKIMGEMMTHAGEPECKVPMKSDPTCVYRWYEDVAGAHVKKEYEEAIASGKSPEIAFDEVYANNCEFTKEDIEKYINE